MTLGWWQDPVAQALLAGGAYLLLWLALGELFWRMERRRGRPVLRGLWGQAAGLLLSAGIMFALLIGGVLAPGDVGLRRPDVRLAWPELLGLWAVEGAWVALLWARLGPRSRTSAAAPQPAWLAAFCTLAQQEAALATLRAALAPLLGLYWGAWLATLCRGLVARSHPQMALRLADPEQGAETRLIWALDALSTALVLVSGSVWVALAGRLAGHGAVSFVRHLWGRRRVASAAP